MFNFYKKLKHKDNERLLVVTPFGRIVFSEHHDASYDSITLYCKRTMSCILVEKNKSDKENLEIFLKNLKESNVLIPEIFEKECEEGKSEFFLAC